MADICSACGRPMTDYSNPHCRCGHLVGFPNYRKAKSEQAELQMRYDQATADLKRANLETLQQSLEQISEDSLPVISMSYYVCMDLMQDKKYINYFEKIRRGDRDPAKESVHADRVKVGETLYPNHFGKLHYAVLSPTRTGLPTYGDISVTFDVSNEYLEPRTSLLERNEFRFFDQHGLAPQGAVVPMGYRAVWQDRKKLVVAKLAGDLNASTSKTDLPGLLLKSATHRHDDEFIEIVIYTETGIDNLDVVGVHIEKVRASTEDRSMLDLIRARCTARKIAVTS
jgi:hypothetical protein